jgi:hypothetical protein
LISTVDEHPRAGVTIESLRKTAAGVRAVDGAAGIITAATSFRASRTAARR